MAAEKPLDPQYRTVISNKGEVLLNRFVNFLIKTACALSKPFFPVKVYGPRKLPIKKTLLVGNHISGWDPLMYTLWSKTPISFVYKAEFRKSAFLRWVFDGLDFIPVHRGKVDLNATKCVLRQLEGEKIVGLFPEGTRNPNVDCLQEFHTGAAMFAIKSRAPLRPFYIWEKTKIFHRNYIIVGEEFSLEEFYGQALSKEVLQEATDIIRRHVDDLRVQLNGILAERGVKRRKRTKKEMEKIQKYNEKQKTLAKEIAKQQSQEGK